MVRRYDDPVDVRRQDEQPGQFLWRGRLYVVRGVLAHWVEARRWWTAPSAQAVYTADITGDAAGNSGNALAAHPDGDPAAHPSGDPAAHPDGDPAAHPSGDPAAHPGMTGVDDGEREVWRVEAAAGRGDGLGVYDLCFDWSAGAWTLLRALD